VAPLQAARGVRGVRAAGPARAARAAGVLPPHVRRQAWPDGLVQPAVQLVRPLVPRATRGAPDGWAAPPVVPSPDATGGERQSTALVAGRPAVAPQAEAARRAAAVHLARRRPRRPGSRRKRCCRHCSARAGRRRGPWPGSLGTPFRTTDR